MFVVVNQKTMAITGPFETEDAALSWIDRKQAANAQKGSPEGSYDVERLCDTYIA